MALLDQQQMESLSPFFGTGIGKVTGRVLKKFLNLDDFAACYEQSAEGGATGPAFAHNVLVNTGADYQVHGIGRLRQLIGKGPFITVSNHPYGGMDGIILVDLLGHLFPDYKVLVNKILSLLEAMQPSFITVTPTATQRTAPTRDSINGIRLAMQHLREGHPLGIFPAGAVSDMDRRTREIRDREWQDPIIRLIRKVGVPIVPIRFFDGNTSFYYKLEWIDWKLRLLRLPTEVINKGGRLIRVGIGEVILPEEQAGFSDIAAFREFLRSRVYDMPLPEHFQPRAELGLDGPAAHAAVPASIPGTTDSSRT